MNPHCTATTKAGNPCKNHAKKGEQLCSSHAGTAGAPAGNQNARKHGFYSSIITADERADLVAHATEMSLADELGLNRVLLRRAGEYLLNRVLLRRAGEYLMAEELTLSQFAHVVNLIQNGSRVILQLIQQSEQSESIWDDVLDELSRTLGMKL
jgi:hypothetical protein